MLGSENLSFHKLWKKLSRGHRKWQDDMLELWSEPPRNRHLSGDLNDGCGKSRRVSTLQGGKLSAKTEMAGQGGKPPQASWTSRARHRTIGAGPSSPGEDCRYCSKSDRMPTEKPPDSCFGVRFSFWMNKTNSNGSHLNTTHYWAVLGCWLRICQARSKDFLGNNSSDTHIQCEQDHLPPSTVKETEDQKG